jgi:threonine/homoserine/homoserine lactone efflux protein
MHPILPPLPLLLAFVAASLVLAVTPGPAVLYIVTRSVTQGRRAGLASVAGVALGNLGNAFGASVGLAALFAISSLAYVVIKYCGAAYLIYLGFRALSRESSLASGEIPVVAPRRIFADGALVALLNPKTALFFAAFLPQFMDPAASALGQALALGALFVVLASCTDCCYALLSSMIAPRLAQARRLARLGRWASASAFFGLGAYAAFSGQARVPH